MNVIYTIVVKNGKAKVVSYKTRFLRKKITKPIKIDIYVESDEIDKIIIRAWEPYKRFYVRALKNFKAVKRISTTYFDLLDDVKKFMKDLGFDEEDIKKVVKILRNIRKEILADKL